MFASRAFQATLLFLAAASGAPGAVRADEAAPNVAAPLVVRVYHTNDVHGWIMARPSTDALNPGIPVGGAAAFKSLLDRDATPKLVLDAGDWWQGTPEGSLTKGEAVAEVFNAVGYDAVEIGNHEFDAGQDNLKKLIGELKMPVLAANVYGADGKRVTWTQPWIIKEVDGVKFGIFGLLTSHMDKLAFPKNIAGLTFRREIDEARDDVKALRRRGAEVIIAVTHVGYEEEGRSSYEGDKALAREVEGIDLIVGGHSHTFLSRAYRDPQHGTLIVQAGSYLTRVGRTTLKLDPKTHQVLSAADELLDLRPERVGENAAVQAIVRRRAGEVGAVYEAVIATATAQLSRSAGQESGLGSWMSDCYRTKTGADFALQNGGGIRSDIPAGPVTLRRIFNVMPFDNTLVKLKMTGAQLRATLNHGLGAARVAQFSGAAVEFVPGAPVGARLASVSVGGSPLDDAKSYSVVTIDFLVSGGDGYQEFAAAPQEQTGMLARDALAACAREQGLLAPPPAGRLRAKGGS